MYIIPEHTIMSKEQVGDIMRAFNVGEEMRKCCDFLLKKQIGLTWHFAIWEAVKFADPFLKDNPEWIAFKKEQKIMG